MKITSIAVFVAIFAIATAAVEPAGSQWASGAVSFAIRQVGKAYSQTNRLGPNSFDCSGLVRMAYESAGKYGLPNTTAGYPGGLKKVSTPEAGDILWKSGHVAIYIGNDEVVHAANSQKGVTRVKYSSYYVPYLGVSAIYRP